MENVLKETSWTGWSADTPAPTQFQIFFQKLLMDIRLIMIFL
jgi:hypothetical protein